MKSASNTLPEAQRLRHLVVTQYTDAFDADMPGPEAPGPQWQEWLATRHPLPSLDGGNVTAWTDALAAGHRPPEHVVAANDMALLPDGPIKTFTLRGIKDSPPYLHDGRLPTLADTVEFFNLVLGTRLTADEKQALTAYLLTL